MHYQRLLECEKRSSLRWDMRADLWQARNWISKRNVKGGFGRALDPCLFVTRAGHVGLIGLLFEIKPKPSSRRLLAQLIWQAMRVVECINSSTGKSIPSAIVDSLFKQSVDHADV